MNIERRSVMRFVQYSLIGAGTFLFDLLLLYILTDFFLMNHVLAAGISFLIAVSINYQFSRRFVFKGTKRSLATGYTYFILIAGSGFLFVTASMYVLVDVLGLYYLFARVSIAGLTGIWNYCMNLFFNFKMAGVYDAT